MFASLPMYPIYRADVEAFWRAIAADLRGQGVPDVPDHLQWPDDILAEMRRPDLLLGQTCGYPLVTLLKDAVRVVGAFRYTTPGCDGARYSSVVIARVDETAADIAGFRGRRVAYNSTDSQSGYNSLRALVAPLAVDGRFFGASLETGAHHASMRAVAEGRADVAAIDCVSFAQIAAIEPMFAAKLKVVGHTPSAPGLPLITHSEASDDDIAALRGALGRVATDPSLTDIRSRLLIAGFEPLDDAPYADIIAMETGASTAGYPTLS
jgi:ABC-type phosphate/phosphonate transport system substrate-binding protein